MNHPEWAQGRCEREPWLCLLALQRPLQPRVEIIILLFHPLHEGHLLSLLQSFNGCATQPEEKLQVPVSQPPGLPRFQKRILGILAYRLQQAESHHAIRWDTGGGGRECPLPVSRAC